MFWKVESPCVALAHKPFSKNEILFKKFSNQNKNAYYFHEIASRVSVPSKGEKRDMSSGASILTKIGTNKLYDRLFENLK